MHEIHSYRMYRMEEWGHSSWRWWVSGWSQNCTWFCASCTWSRDTATVDWQGRLMSLDLTAAVLSAIKSAYQYWPLGPTWHTGRCMWTGAISEIEIKGVFAAAFTTRMASHWHWPMGTGDLWDQSVHSFCMSISDDRGLVNLCTNLSFWLMVITSSIRLRLDRRLSSLFLTSTCRRGAFTHCAPCGRPEGILQQDITSSMAFLRGVSVDSHLLVTHVNLFCVSFSVWRAVKGCLEQTEVPELLPALLQFTLMWAVLSLWTAVLSLIFYLVWKGNYVITCCYLNSYSSLESLHEQVALCVCAEFVSAHCEDEARVDLLFYFGVVWVKCT